MMHKRARGTAPLLCFALAAAGVLVCAVPAGAAVAGLPFHDDFDYPVLGPWWSASGTDPGPLSGGWWYRLLDTCGPPSGARHLILDSGAPATANRNEVTLTVDLAGRSRVYLSFLAKSFADTPHPLSPWQAYTGSKDFDGVAVSPDGVTWYPVLNLTENDGLTRAYTPYSVSLDDAVSGWGISYTAAFRIRFNHYNNGQVVSASGNAGLGIDAVSVFESPPPTSDFGDAPAPYPTLLADDGARHLDAGPMLGAARDMTADGEPTDDASGDGADEDGVVFIDPPVPGHAAALRITASSAAMIDAWMDFNLNGSWGDPGEQLLTAAPVAAGDNILMAAIPAGAQVSDRVFARFRLSTAGGLAPTGGAVDGEVEDYRVSVVPDTPVMDPEPALTPGTANTVSWSSVGQADGYYAECSQTADFSVPFQASGWIPSTSQNFVGLADIAQYYRVRAARTLPGDEASWSQTTDAEFSLDTRSGTALYGGGKVSLQGPAIHTDTLGGANELLKGTAANTGRFNVFAPTQPVRLTGFSMLLSRDSAMNVELAVYEGNSTNFGSVGWSSEKKHSQVLAVDAGIGFLSVEGISLTLTPGKYYALGLSWSGTASSFKAPTGTTVSFGTVVGTAQSTQYPGQDPLTNSNPYSTFSGSYYMRVSTTDDSAYLSSGYILSPVIAPPSWIAWRTLNYTADTPPGTAITVDLLPESGSTPVPGWSSLAPGANLGTLTAMPVRLRARLTTSDTAVTPALLDWGLTWQAVPDRRVEGAWSAPVMSTQDGLAPFVVSVTPSGPNPARTPTVRFLVQYSESVTGVAQAAPFPDFAVRAGSVPGASIVAVAQAGDATRYEVEVATGSTGGTLALDAVTGGAIQDASGNPLAAGRTDGAAYTLDYSPPTVGGITRLDPSPTNAPTVRFAVTFSEPVTGVPLTAPFTGFTTTGLTGTSVQSITGGGASYTVTVQTGAWDGTVRLAVGTAGAVRDAAGWPLASGMASPSGYQMTHLRFTAVPEALISVDSGDSCSMSVAVAGGTGTRSYQWYLDDAVKAYAAVPGANEPVLEMSRVWLEDDGNYYCEVSDAHETIQSPPARLSVRAVLPAAGVFGLSLAAAVLAMAGAGRLRRGRLYPFRRAPL